MTLPDLATLERAGFRSLFADGLLDVALGLWLVLASYLVSHGHAVAAGIAMVLLLPAWEWARRRRTVPRLGVARTAPAARRRRLVPMIAVCCVLLGLGVILAATRGSGPRALEDFFARSPHLLLGLTLFVLLGGLAATLGVPRLLGYAIVVLALFAGGEPVGLAFPLSQAAAGVVVAVAGLLVLRRFLRTHPVIDADYVA